MDSLKKKWIFMAAALIVFLGVGGTLNFWWNLGNAVGYAPEQPIPFSHKRHAGDNQIPCLYCHVGADQGRHATIPSTNVCMNCHSVVKADHSPGTPGSPHPNYSPSIQKLRELYEKGEPIEWIKVHDQPDFVFFNHKRHVLKGVACETCHGDVAQMDRTRQVKSLNMGFCVDCHRQKEASITCYTCHH